MKSNQRKNSKHTLVALFTAKHIVGNSDLVNDLAMENRLHFLDEAVRQFLWERIVEELALEYVVSKKIPRHRRVIKVIKDEMAALFEGKYDEEFQIKW
jgi:hypothetical protein